MPPPRMQVAERLPVGQRLSQLLQDRRTPQYLMLFALLCATPLIFRMQRDAVPWADEWPFLLYRDGWSLGDFFSNYNGHLMPLAALVFKLDGVIFYPGAQLPLTVTSAALQLVLAWIVFIYARRRIDDWAAFGIATLLLVYGAGYEVTAWSMNLGWLASLAAGMGALALFDLKSTRGRDIGVTALLLLSMMGCNLGLMFAAAIAIRGFDKSERRRVIKIAAAPIVLWALWWLIDNQSGGSPAGYFPKSWLPFILTLVEYGFGGIPGFVPGTAPTWGAPLAVAAILAGLYKLNKDGRLRVEIASVTAIPILFWFLTAVGRGGWAPASTSRYTYTSFVLLIPVIVEFARGFKIRGSGLAVGLALIWVLVMGSNINALSAGSQSLRGSYVQTRTYLTALAKVGEPIACTTKYDKVEPGLHNEPNCVVRAWLMKNADEPFTYSAAELADPARAAAVDAIVRQMREQTPQ